MSNATTVSVTKVDGAKKHNRVSITFEEFPNASTPAVALKWVLSKVDPTYHQW